MAGTTKEKPALNFKQAQVNGKEIEMPTNKDDQLFRNILKGFVLIGVLSIVVNRRAIMTHF